ncbi:glycosyltransferase family 4 protein [Paraburkholderia sp. J67]|uniref:glycosyltransferase family 4 protein n=1 Tax=Paraburkholderia sp. J67 TaxID=2805435 RepID=UPI0039F5ED3A
MRILIVTHQFAKNDGQGRVNYEIVRAALAAGHSVTMLSSSAADELSRHPRARFVKIESSRAPTRLLQYQVFAWRSWRWIRAHRDEFDVVHVNGFITWATADVNSVHFVHDGWYRCGFYPFRLFRSAREAYQVIYTRLNAYLEARAFRQARAVVAVSGKVRDEMRVSGVDARRLQVIYNGVDIDEFAPGPAERSRFGLPDAPFLFLFAGDLRIARKNLDTVLHALRDAPANAHLVVAADLRGNQRYPALAAELGVAERVHFLDFVRDMPALMRSVDAFVFPSRYEAMSLVLLEALAAALPVVTARTTGGAEVVGADCGLVLENPDDVAGIAAAIDYLASDPERSARMGQAARELARTLGWDVMAQRYLSLYEHVCATRSVALPEAAAAVVVDS